MSQDILIFVGIISFIILLGIILIKSSNKAIDEGQQPNDIDLNQPLPGYEPTGFSDRDGTSSFYDDEEQITPI